MTKLPEKWCIKRNLKNALVINAWANKSKKDGFFNSDEDWLYHDSERNSPIYTSSGFDTDKKPLIEGYKIINFAQFKKLIC